MLSAEQQERFSRHLLLDHLGGRGQERLCAGAVAIDLPATYSLLARACARALAAAGVGRLWLRGSWAEGAMAECTRLAPGIEIVCAGHEGEPDFVSGQHQAVPEMVSRQHQAGPKMVSERHEGAPTLVSIAHQAAGPDTILLPALPPLAPADASALGALAALAALKLLAGAGRPAPGPLEVFARSER